MSSQSSSSRGSDGGRGGGSGRRGSGRGYHSDTTSSGGTPTRPAKPQSPSRLPPSLPSLTPERSQCRDPRLLLLFDLDGTLVYRKGKGDGSVDMSLLSASSSSSSSSTSSSSVSDAHATTHLLCSLSAGPVYLRGYAVPLLRALLTPPLSSATQVAFYTSMTAPNAVPLCRALIHHVLGIPVPASASAEDTSIPVDSPQCFSFPLPSASSSSSSASTSSSSSAATSSGQYWVFPREFNTPDPTGSKHWDTIRDLSRIWASSLNSLTTPAPTVAAGELSQLAADLSSLSISTSTSSSSPPMIGTVEVRFGPHNTVLIDNEPRKTRMYARNALHVASWDREAMTSEQMHRCQALLPLTNIVTRFVQRFHPDTTVTRATEMKEMAKEDVGSIDVRVLIDGHNASLASAS